MEYTTQKYTPNNKTDYTSRGGGVVNALIIPEPIKFYPVLSKTRVIAGKIEGRGSQILVEGPRVYLHMYVKEWTT